MKICFMVSAMNSGGAERVVSILANNMSKNHDVTILMISVSKKDTFYQLDKNVALVPLLKTNKKPNYFKKARLIRKFISSLNPDVVISFLPHVCIYSYFAIRNLKIPLILSERNDPNHYSFIYKILLKYVFKRSSYCIFQTQDARDWYSIKNDKCSIIYNPVKLNYLPKENVILKRKENIICVARLNIQKNIPFLLDCFNLFLKTYPNYILNIYGKGNEEINIKNKINELNLENKVVLKGADPNWHLNEYDAGCYVLSSNFEGMPNSLIEAAILAIPCVATNCPIGGSKEIANICDNVNLVSVNNKKEMVDAMIEAINLKTTFKGIPKQFDEKYITNQWIDVILNVINKNNQK